jgi:hypothetical protein
MFATVAKFDGMRDETANRVRDKLAALHLTEKDLEDAVNWARQGAE